MADVSLEQLPIEVAVADDGGSAQLEQMPIEVAHGDAGPARLHQMVLEVAYLEPDSFAGAGDPIPWKRTGTKVSVGTNVDQMTLSLYPKLTSLLQGLPWVQAVQLGVLDGAKIVLERA